MKTLNDNLIGLYLEEHIAITERFPVSEIATLVQAIEQTYKRCGQVFIFGNGGGASIADHFASDLAIHPFVSENKKSSIPNTRLTVHCLNTSNGLLTRLANDIGFEVIFTEQLKSYFIEAKDIVIALSTSGNSLNIFSALAYAHLCGATTVLIGGRDGGKAKEYADICILIPGHSEFPGQIGANDNCFHIEDFQQSIAHMVTGILKEEING